MKLYLAYAIIAIVAALYLIFGPIGACYKAGGMLARLALWESWTCVEPASCKVKPLK